MGMGREVEVEVRRLGGEEGGRGVFGFFWGGVGVGVCAREGRGGGVSPGGPGLDTAAR